MLAVSVFGDDGKTPIDWRLCLVPKSDYTIIDTWYAMGMAGTGSKDVVVTELFAPECRALALQLCRGGYAHPGGTINRGPLYGIPIVAASSHPLAPPTRPSSPRWPSAAALIRVRKSPTSRPCRSSSRGRAA
jgi:hypothetical protein